jgi:Na+/H+ antiporter NhaD/arsenite permease-like protein
VRWLGSSVPHSTHRAAFRASVRRRAPSENHAADSARIRPFGPTCTDAGGRAGRATPRPCADQLKRVRVERHRGRRAYLIRSVRGTLGGIGATNLVAIAVFAAVFGALVARQLSDRGPRAWAILGIGAVVTVVVGVLPWTGAAHALALDAPTLLFLLALFVLARALESSGALAYLARWLVGRAPRPADLPFVLFVGLGLGAAFLVNDALVVIGVPLLIAVASGIGTRPKPLLLVLAFSVTVGSMLTPFGNPQNLLVAVASGLASPVATFLRYLAVPTGINLVVGGLYVRWAYGRSFPPADDRFERVRAAAPPLLPRGGWGPRVRGSPVLVIFPATMVALVGFDLFGAIGLVPAIPDWEIALAGAGLALLTTPGRLSIVRHVNWSILVLFAGLFVVVAGAVAGGVVGGIEAALPIPGPGHGAKAVLAIVGTSILGTQLVSNVPWVALQLPVLSGIGYSGASPIAWVALAGGSTLAGNVTLLGAASNLLLVDAAARRGISIRLGEFVRAALPVFAITTTVLVVCLLLGI